MKQYPVVSANGHLAENPIWNVPSNTNEVRGSLATIGMWSVPVSYRALAMDKHGRVFGLRTMFQVRESGYSHEGRVSVAGKRYRAFTSSKLFTRRDGTLCTVAIVYVCGTPDKQWPDPLTVPKEAYRAYLNDLQSRYHYEETGAYASLRDYALALERIADGTAEQYPWANYKDAADRLRNELVEVMGW